jgi:ribosomal protein L37AE/L43A
MGKVTKISQDKKPVYCRNCYIPMVRTLKSWLCEKCGLEWNDEGNSKTKQAAKVPS